MVRRFLVRSALLVLLNAFVAGPAHAALSVDAPSSLTPAAARVRAVDLEELRRALDGAGLTLPDDVHVTLVADADARAQRIPRWVVGLASGTRDIVIFPERVPPYPYDSIESVLRHEIAHLALALQAGGAPLPRWFHEGVAMSVDTGWDTAGRLRLLMEMIRNPRTERVGQLFASEVQQDGALAYGLSAALVADLQRRHGRHIVVALAARVSAGVPFPEAFER